MSLYTENDLVEFFSEAQSKLVIQTSDLSLKTLADMVEGEDIDLQPSFQRRQRWNDNERSQLIESFIMNIPVPPIYLSEDEYGRYTAIDGKQRLQAITDFIYWRYKLKGLLDFKWGNWKSYDELPRDIQNTFKVRPFLRVVTLLKQSDPTLRYQVFLRLNRAWVPLNAQEIRNVAFRGPLNDKIVELSGNPFLGERLGIDSNNKQKSNAYKEMMDVEYVLRFLAIYHESDFKGDFRETMDNFLRQRTGIEPLEVMDYEHEFLRALNICERIWGKHAFNRYDQEKHSWRDQFLAGMFDAQMQAVSELFRTQFDNLSDSNTETIIRRTTEAFLDPTFDDAVRSWTNTPKKLRYRINKIKEILALPY